MAESTFGRLAVNDGKFVNRLKYGGRITTQTLARVRNYMVDPTPRGFSGPKSLLLSPPPPAPRRPRAPARAAQLHGPPPAAGIGPRQPVAAAAPPPAPRRRQAEGRAGDR